MTGEKNVYKYITTEGKRTGKFTALEYLQKNTGVFNQKGMLSQSQIDEMRARLKENKGNIWHGFISLNKEESHKIDTTEKCISMVKATFNSFLKDAHLNEKNIDLMCALHLDKPHHLHMHFVFWEKEARFKGKDGNKEFRLKGKIQKSAIDNMFIRLGLFIDDDKNRLFKTRNEAIQKLKQITSVNTALATNEEIKEDIITLAKNLPKTGRLSYGSDNMEMYRDQVDGIVQKLLNYDRKARIANKHFYQALEERRLKIQNICGLPFAYSEGNKSTIITERDYSKYNYKINIENIKIIEEIKADYQRRQGNLIVSLAKFIKPEYYERKKGKNYKSNDNKMKRSIAVSTRKINSLYKRFLSGFGRESQLLERDFTHRLNDITKEIEQEKKKQMEGGEYKD